MAWLWLGLFYLAWLSFWLPGQANTSLFNASRRVIPESDEEDEEEEDEGQGNDSEDEEIEAAYAKLQADRLAEGQEKVCLPLNQIFYY
jgi:hypothetical protein